MSKIEARDGIENARETFQVLTEIASILNTNLDAESLTFCIRLCEIGIHPDSLAHIVLEMQSEVANYQHSKKSSTQ